MVESCNEKCKNAEQNLLEAQKVIAALESNILLLKHENEKSLKEIQGMLCYILYLNKG